MKELASGEPVISIQSPVFKGHLEYPLGLCKSVYNRCNFVATVLRGHFEIASNGSTFSSASIWNKG